MMILAICACRDHRPVPVRAEIPRPTPIPPIADSGPNSAPTRTREPGVAPRDTARVDTPPVETTETLVDYMRRLNAELLQDAFFDYDRSDVRPDAIAALRKDADLLLPVLARFPELRLTIEGHCDERGSAEYNLALGDRRARRAAEVLHGFGIPEARWQIVSYGREAPQCTEPVESCWQRNRRAHLSCSTGLQPVPGQAEGLSYIVKRNLVKM
jgi:peptidoglycan-associated lipoprotein